MRHGQAASVHAVDVVDATGELHRLVLKRCVRTDPSEPDQAAREAGILTLLEIGAVRAPRLLAVDAEGAFGGVPALLMTRLEGRVVLQPRNLRSWTAGLAGLLPAIHATPARPHQLAPYRAYEVPDSAEPPADSQQPAAWRSAIARVRGPVPSEPGCFIHRDFHPGNVLWTGRSPSGIVDWLHGCWGPPAADLGHCRWNLWYLHGSGVADDFLAAYRRQVPDTPPYDPYWDLAAALGGGFESDGRVSPRRDPRGRLVLEEMVSAAARLS